MKPLATPVLGGMVSSLLYVLIVTPVLFAWIHERRLGVAERAGPARVPVGATRARPAAAIAIVLVAAAAAATWFIWAGPARDAGRVVETVRTGDLLITVSNAGGTLRQGANQFRIEFRSTQTSELVDVGEVQLGAAMTMPGMVMTSPIAISRTGQAGVYEARGEYSMAGSWQMTLEWNGPAGRGSAAFDGDVQ
jgi:Cu(I)/Ag(I) efflux system membrane protein CusA/SilA